MARITKEQMYMEIAGVISKRSTCSRLQVGSVITDASMKNILSIGYNGNYAGGPDHCDTEEAGLCGCIHSEINAIIKCPSVEDRVMFITDSPCVTCAKTIVNSGIKIVYYRREYRVKDGLRLLKKAKVKVIKI